MAHSATTRNKDHSRRRNARHEQRVMVCTAHHLFIWEVERGACTGYRLDDPLIAGSRRIGIHDLNLSSYAATVRNLLHPPPYRGQYLFPAASIDVADVDFELYTARHAIHRTGEDIAHAGCRHRIHSA